MHIIYDLKRIAAINFFKLKAQYTYNNEEQKLIMNNFITKFLYHFMY